MSFESLAPDVLALQTNLAGPVAFIQDDPDSPDAAWLTAIDSDLNTIMRCKFSDPSIVLRLGADRQEFRVYVRKTDNGLGGDPVMVVDLYENGSYVARLESSQVVTSTTGVVYSFTWDAALLPDTIGAEVELYIRGIAA